MQIRDQFGLINQKVYQIELRNSGQTSMEEQESPKHISDPMNQLTMTSSARDDLQQSEKSNSMDTPFVPQNEMMTTSDETNMHPVVAEKLSPQPEKICDANMNSDERSDES